MVKELSTKKSVEVADPISGEKRLVSLDRTGYSEVNLITTLADPEIPRDRKDFVLSMYLYERGAHSASMIADIMRYKGQHTKESRVFKSQIRFDFESFVNSFTMYLTRQSRLIGLTLGINIAEERSKFVEWLALENNKGKGYTYKDYNKHDSTTYTALVEMAIEAQDEAAVLMKNVKNLRDARTREKGKGIYLSRDGTPYTEDDPQLDDIIKADREATAEESKDL